MIATMNAFAPLHAFNSSRSWFLALIVLMHLGFFWALSNGLSVGSLQIVPKGVIEFLPEPAKPQPPPRQIPIEPTGIQATVTIVDPPLPMPIVESETVIQVSREPTPLTPQDEAGPGSADPVIVQPQIDPRIGLTEPIYPPEEIRKQHTGTVVLSVQVLPSGRIGAVRVERSSGYPRLDESAVREARRWRKIAGSRDGQAVDMWKQIPITFRLRN